MILQKTCNAARNQEGSGTEITPEKATSFSFLLIVRRRHRAAHAMQDSSIGIGSQVLGRGGSIAKPQSQQSSKESRGQREAKENPDRMIEENAAEHKKWRREWESNPPEPVLQTVALTARPSRLKFRYGIYYKPNLKNFKSKIGKKRKKACIAACGPLLQGRLRSAFQRRPPEGSQRSNPEAPVRHSGAKFEKPSKAMFRICAHRCHESNALNRDCGAWF